MRVVMLANNSCVSDARIIREAEALAASGHDVHVVAHWAPGLPTLQNKGGVAYHRVPVRPADKWAWRKHQRRGAPLHADPAHAPGGDAPAAAIPLPDKSARATSTGGSKNFSIKAFGGESMSWVAEVSAALQRRAVTTVLTPFLAILLQHARTFPKVAIPLRPDAVHAHDLYTLLAGHRIAKATGARLIYDSHELETGRNGNFSQRETNLRARTERWLIQRTDAVVTVCDSIADHLVELYGIARPTVVLNAPSQEEHRRVLDQAQSAGLRARLGLSEAAPLAVYVGSVTINRGLEQCVEALAHAPELHFATVGPRRLATEAELIRLAEAHGVRDRLHLVDPVPHDQVTAFVRSADVSLITIQNVCLSYKFCFPNKLLESLLAGVPVVVGRLVELEKMIALTKAGVVVDETDPKAIAAGIIEVLSDHARYTPTPETIAWLLKNYSWDTQRLKLAQLYEGLQRPAGMQGGQPTLSGSSVL